MIGAGRTNAFSDAKRLAYLVTEDWYFLSHRLPMARAARDAGFEVHVLTRIDQGRGRIEAEGFVVHPIDLKRGVARPAELLAAARRVRARLKLIRPLILHNVALQPVLAGSIASLGMSHGVVNAVTGLGAVFAARKGVLARLVKQLLVVLLNRRRSTTLVQNPDDRDTLVGWGVRSAAIALIPGSGVDIDRFTPMPQPAGPFTAAYVGRMLSYKGPRLLAQAWGILRRRGREYRLILAGTPDPRNPTSIPESEILGWCADGGIVWRGKVEDVRTVWRDAHVAVLPSESEGLPLSLLEAAACARPVIAGDAPGSREIARSGVNGELVPLGDAEALAEAIDRLAKDVDLRARYGAESRRLAVEEFSSQRIQRETAALYRSLAVDR